MVLKAVSMDETTGMRKAPSNMRAQGDEDLSSKRDWKGEEEVEFEEN